MSLTKSQLLPRQTTPKPNPIHVKLVKRFAKGSSKQKSIKIKTSWSSGALKTLATCPQNASRRPQDGSKRHQNRPMTNPKPPRGFKILSRRLQISYLCPQHLRVTSYGPRRSRITLTILCYPKKQLAYSDCEFWPRMPFWSGTAITKAICCCRSNHLRCFLSTQLVMLTKDQHFLPALKMPISVHVTLANEQDWHYFHFWKLHQVDVQANIFSASATKEKDRRPYICGATCPCASCKRKAWAVHNKT